MAIVAKKRGSTRPRGGGETRWKRVVPWAGAAVLVALVALLAWRMNPPLARRAHNAPRPKSELKLERTEPRPPDADEPPAPSEEHAAARSESSPHQEEESSPHPAGRPEVAPYQGEVAGEPAVTNQAEEAEEAEKPSKHFRHPSEQLLAMVLSTPPDSQMPPLPQLDPEDERLNADALAASTNFLVIYETDSEELERLKERVAEAKIQLDEVVAGGGNVADALNEFREWQNEGVEIRNGAIGAINAIEDDAEAAEAFAKANEELEKEGIPPIQPEEVGMVAAEDAE